MSFICLVHRLDEEESEGTAFNSVKEAHDHLKKRAVEEEKDVTDFIINVIEIYE